MEMPILRMTKHADATAHKIIIPLEVIQRWGLDYYMEIYEDKIILKPIKRKED